MINYTVNELHSLFIKFLAMGLLQCIINHLVNSCTFCHVKMMAIYMLFGRDFNNFTLCQPEYNLEGNNVMSPLTTGSQHKPYGHHGCYLVKEIVFNIMKKGHGR